MIRTSIEGLIAGINENVANGYKISRQDQRFVVWCTFRNALDKRDADRLQEIYRKSAGGGQYQQRERI